MRTRFLGVGAAAATAIGGWGAIVAAQATPAAAATCDMSDAIVIGVSSIFVNDYGGEQNNTLGKLYVNDSRSCHTEWAYLELSGPLPSGATANASYDGKNGNIWCDVAVGDRGCSTPPYSIDCFNDGSLAFGYKRTANYSYYQIGPVYGSTC